MNKEDNVPHIKQVVVDCF